MTVKQETRHANRFMGRPSPAYLKALAALQELAAESLDSVDRVYAEATTQLTENQWIKRQSVHRSKASPCIRRITHGACLTATRMEHCICQPPGSDHVDLWIKDGKARVYTSQPYELSWEELQEMVDFCRHDGLQADISLGAWHFPGRTMLIEYRRQNDEREW